MRVPVLCLLIVLLTGCGSAPQMPSDVSQAMEKTALKISRGELRRPLNISLRKFTSPVELSDSIYLVDSQLRSVEARLIPYSMRQTLTRSGYWGAVRLMPGEDPAAELQLRGQILASSGTELKLAITVTDAAGRAWLNRIYEDAATDLDYRDDPDPAIDPFQDLYNRIANDLGELLALRSAAELERLSTIASIRYAEGLSPEAFSGYLLENESGITLRALPAENDPLFEAVTRVRESEYLFSDAVDEHYESLQRQVGTTYAWWRYYNYELIRGNERLARIDATRGATSGSWYAVERVYKTFKDAKMNQDALRELTDSFDRETAPVVTKLAGKVVELTGSLEQQYELWRSILRDMYFEETGS